ncbi:ATP-binding protein [Streptomyces sp. NPDC002795]|uniref:ATP-binding protein n=1 Tax=Streptomyces sp. NPDC002795 TaxID=3364665 RepID=UPI0036C6D4B4
MKSETATPAQLPSPPPEFRVRLSSTRRGVRLARLLVERHLEEQGISPGDPTAVALVAITAELAANAITHGRTPGRDFEVRLHLTPTLARVEVRDTRPDKPLPPPSPTAPPAPEDHLTSTDGRGLLLVDHFADRWGCEPHDAYTKTTWVEVARQPTTLL